MARSLLVIALLVVATAAAAAPDPMFSLDGTLAHRVALDTDVSDACVAATLAVQNEFATREQIAEINRACAKEIRSRADAGANLIEIGADGHVCMPYLGNGSGFVDMKDPRAGIFDFVSDTCTTWE